MASAVEDVVVRLTGERQRLIGAAIARFLIGAAGVHFYVSGYADRRFLWGPDSAIPLASRVLALEAIRPVGILPSLSLYSFSASDAWFQTVFHGGLIAALLFALVGGRRLAAAHWIFLTSLYERNPFLLDGGDKLARILVLFLCLACTDAYFSPHAARRRAAFTSAKGPTLDALSHNVGMLLCVFQTAVVYFQSGLAKLAGPRWRDGTAIYYATRNSWLHFMPQLDWVTAAPLVRPLVTYGVMATELLYPVLVLARRTRGIAVGLAVSMHVAIALKMGLVGFAIVMLGANAAILTDDSYKSAWRAMRRVAIVRFWKLAT